MQSVPMERVLLNTNAIEYDYIKSQNKEKIFNFSNAITGATATSKAVELKHTTIRPIVSVEVEGIVSGISVKPSGFKIGSALDVSGNITGSDAREILFEDYADDTSTLDKMESSVYFGSANFDIINTIDNDSELKVISFESNFKEIIVQNTTANYIQFIFDVVRPSGNTTALRFSGHIYLR